LTALYGQLEAAMLMVTIAFSDDTGRNNSTKLYDRLTGSGAAFQVCVRAEAGPPPNNAL